MTFVTQRRYPRMKVDIRVQLQYTINGKKQTCPGRGHDVGQGGLAIYVPVELTVGQPITIAFELPYSRNKFLSDAVIRNCNGFRYGIEFMNLDDAQRAEIARVGGILALMETTA